MWWACFEIRDPTTQTPATAPVAEGDQLQTAEPQDPFVQEVLKPARSCTAGGKRGSWAKQNTTNPRSGSYVVLARPTNIFKIFINTEGTICRNR